jgi:hypothetical protein
VNRRETRTVQDQPAVLASPDPYDSSTALDGRTATGTLLQSGGTIVDNAEGEGAARTRLLAFLAALH